MNARLGASLERLPRLALGVLPTPLHPAPKLSRRLGVDLWVKREDLTGLAFGGNKVRSAEYLAGEAAARGATFLITTAAAQSNFCRVMAAAGAAAGLGTGLLLRGTGGEPLQGNLLLDHLLGAEVRFTQDADPYSEETRARLAAWAEEARAGGGRPYVTYMHDGGRAGALATAAHVRTALELDAQCAAADIRPRHVYLAAGSGSTLAGLLLGARRTGGRLAAARIAGICVGALPDVLRPKAQRFADSAADVLEVSAPDEPVELDGTQRGDGYGVPTAAALAAIALVARTEGMVLNPVYTGKAFAGLLADIRRGTVRRGETVVFINTGGDPLVFAHAESLAAAAGTRRAEEVRE